MPTITRILLLPCLLLSACSLAWSAEPVRVAVLGAEPPGIGDLLMVRLSKDPSLELVERDQLGSALGEVALRDLMVDRRKRSRFGEIAGADFLVLLNVADKRVRLVVCDTKLGVTLQDQSIGITDQPQEKVIGVLADIAQQTIHSFADGVKQVVAVPDFLCRDLTFEFTYLQADYAEVLRSAYRQIPGTAIVAIEEAKDIAAERDIAGLGQKERIVSFLIEGEYRTMRDPQSARVSLEITLQARDSAKVLMHRKLPSMPASEAGKEMMSVFTKELAGLTQTGEIKIDEASQHRILLTRADEFAAVGEFVRSTALREAALLLKPDDDEQRVKLLREYARHNREPFEYSSWPKGSAFDDSNPLWLEAFNRAVCGWKRALQHCEYLVLNRRLSREEATDLAHDAIRSITGVRAGASERLKDCETLKKDFVRHVYSRIAYLDPAPPEVRGKLTGALDAYHFIFESALFRCDGNFCTADDLDLIADLLLNRLPATMWPSYNLNFFLRAMAANREMAQEGRDGFTIEQYLAFLNRLITSERPMANVYGRYGKLCIARYRRGEKSEDLLAEARAIVAKAETIGFDLREYDYFMDQLRSEVTYLVGDLAKPTREVPRNPQPKPEQPAPKPVSRISLEPIALTIAGKGVSAGNSQNLHRNITNFRPLGKGLDALWCREAVYFMHKSGRLKEVLADNQLGVADVVSDGRYVWIPTFYDKGVLVLDREGSTLASVGTEQGLPPRGLYGLVIHPIAPGRVLVAGSFGSEDRGWIAVVSYDGHSAQVKVIHEATKVWDYRNRDAVQEKDPQMCFAPQAAIEHVIPGPNPRRMLIIQRRNKGMPLLVDLETFGVEVCQSDPTNRESFLRCDPPADAFLSIDGVLWVAGSMDEFCSFRFNGQGKYFHMVRERSIWHSCNATDGSLAHVGDWLYYAGHKWRRLNLVTGKEELLVESLRELPDFGTAGWRIANSTHYGLVAFHEGKLYRVITPSENPPGLAAMHRIMKPSRIPTFAFLGAALCLICIIILRKGRKIRAVTSTPGKSVIKP